MKLAELGEFGLIDRIAGQVRSFTDRVGIGDDASVTEPSKGMVTLTTTDMLLEGVHFDLAYCDPESLGRKSLAVNLSDIAAMGGIPRYAYLSLAVPSHVSVEFLDQFIAGLLCLANLNRVSLVGGDTCASTGGLVISITLVGEQVASRVVRRSGAMEGDLVFVTGTVGDAALGLQRLRQGERTGSTVRRQLDPEPRITEGLALAEAGLPSAMIDVSDGLMADLGHILRQSGVGATLNLPQIPVSEEYLTVFPTRSLDDCAMALGGGEDYELLFTLPPHRREELQKIAGSFTVPFTCIGSISSERGLYLLDSHGRKELAICKGFNHFSL